MQLLMEDSSTIFDTKNINEGTPSILLYFSPDCEHCQREIEDIIQNIQSFKSIKFYLITIDPLERLLVFDRHYSLSKTPNLILGRDYEFSFCTNYPGAEPPYLVIFDRQRKQRFIISGETNSKQILYYINKLR